LKPKQPERYSLPLVWFGMLEFDVVFLFLFILNCGLAGDVI